MEVVDRTRLEGGAYNLFFPSQEKPLAQQQREGLAASATNRDRVGLPLGRSNTPQAASGMEVPDVVLLLSSHARRNRLSVGACLAGRLGENSTELAAGRSRADRDRCPGRGRRRI